MKEIILANHRNFEAWLIESRQIEELIENEAIRNTDINLCDTSHLIDRPFSNFAENKVAQLVVSSSPDFKIGKRSKLILLISLIMASILFLICSSVISCIKRRRSRRQRRQSVHFPLQRRSSNVSVVEVQL